MAALGCPTARTTGHRTNIHGSGAWLDPQLQWLTQEQDFLSSTERQVRRASCLAWLWHCGCLFPGESPQGPRHLPTHQLPARSSGQEQRDNMCSQGRVPADWLPVPAHCPSPQNWVFWKARQAAPAAALPSFFNISCVLLTSVGERHKYRLVLVLNTSSCLLCQPCRQHYPSSWHHHCLIHLTYALEKKKKSHVPNKIIALWSHSHFSLLSDCTSRHLPFSLL